MGKKLLEHDESLDQIGTKVDALLTKDEFLNSMDKVLSAIARLNQERLFQIHRLDRHEEDITKLKAKAGLKD